MSIRMISSGASGPVRRTSAADLTRTGASQRNKHSELPAFNVTNSTGCNKRSGRVVRDEEVVTTGGWPARVKQDSPLSSADAPTCHSLRGEIEGKNPRCQLGQILSRCTTIDLTIIRRKSGRHAENR
jgi:hypothetical protein